MAECAATGDDPIAAKQWKQREQWDKLEVLEQPGVPCARAEDSEGLARHTGDAPPGDSHAGCDCDTGIRFRKGECSHVHRREQAARAALES